MKYISFKKSILPLGTLAVAGSLLLGSCTKNFEEYNTDPYGLTNKDLSVDFKLLGTPIQQIQQNIYVINPAWNTQLQQNLIADIYSNYMATPTPFAGNANNSTYNLVSGWNTYPWDDAYGSVMSQVKSVFDNGQAYPDFIAWARILRVEAMHRVSDIYGPIIYTQFGKVNSDGSVKYDSQKDAYYAFFADLDSAITVLTPLAMDNSATPTFTAFDYSYGGSYAEWVKFANSLRLRLAMRIVNIDPTKAKTEGEAALANPVGIMTTNSDNYNIATGTLGHPLNTINNSWGDIRFGGVLSSFLNGYGDLRGTKYALPATDPAVAPKIMGVRSGIDIDVKDRYEGYSQLVTFGNSIQLMTSAEVWFLKAEAALRGWTGAGDAMTNYNNGIGMSFDQYGLNGGAYMNDATSVPQPYIDPKSTVAGANNVTTAPELSTITIKWDPAATFDQSLERIITQKYIAMYPDGQEAWSEFRRTGYPKIWPNVVNLSGGLIPNAKEIRRIPFAQSEVNTNPIGVAGAVTLLGGPDTGGTPLWWDVR